MHIKLLNIMWCYDREAEQVKVILEHDAAWQLPKTNLGQAESGTEAILRLTEQVTGQVLDAGHVEQLTTLSHPTLVHAGEREVILVYMTYLPFYPTLDTTVHKLFTLRTSNSKYQLYRGEVAFSLTAIADEAKYHEVNKTSPLVYEYALQYACRYIKRSLEQMPLILKILGESFTLREARSVYASFLQIKINQLDNSNFKKTHRKILVEVGQVMRKSPGRPARLYRLKDEVQF